MLKRLMAGAVLATLSIAPVLADEKPNFVIVLGDDASWSSFGCVDAGLYTRTPNIDKLATQGIRFTNMSVSGAMCAPARQELYTGLLPPTSGIYGNGNKLKGEFENLGTYLKSLGYHVGLTGKVHFSSSKPFPKIPGFTHDANDSAPTWELNGVKQFIETAQAGNKPFCVVLGSVHAHHPWTVGDVSKFPLDKIIIPPHMVDGPVTRECLARHAAEVEDLDNQVGATMKLLDTMNLNDNTVLIFLSEQGTAMPNGKYTVYDYGTKALGLVRWPGTIQPGSVTDAVAMYCDITPTLVEIAGGKTADTDGKSLLSVLKGETSDHREHAYLVNQVDGYSQRAIRNKEYKLIWTPPENGDFYLEVMMSPSRAKGKLFGRAWQEWLQIAKTDPDAQAKVDRVVKHPEFELYNIKNDPWELENLADNPEYAPKVQEMRAQLKAEMDALNDSFLFVDPKAAKRAKKGTADKKSKAAKKAERQNKKKDKQL